MLRAEVYARQDRRKEARCSPPVLLNIAFCYLKFILINVAYKYISKALFKAIIRGFKVHSAPPTSPEERRHLKPELALWSKFDGLYEAYILSFCASVTTVHVFFFVIGRVLSRLDFAKQPST